MVRWRFLWLHGLFLLYALGGVAGKTAASYEWGSTSFLLFCGIVIAAFGLYALVWQRLMRYIPLTTAYAHRSVMVFWGMIFGYCFFDELVTIGKMVGIMLTACGLVLFSSERRSEDD